jgi:hypothetical protein
MAGYEKEIEPFFKEYAQGMKDGGIPDAAKGIALYFILP